jgi:chromosome segregation ATPase
MKLSTPPVTESAVDKAAAEKAEAARVAEQESRQSLFAAQMAHADHLKIEQLARGNPSVLRLLTQLKAAEARAADFDVSTGKLRDELLAVESQLASANASIGTYQAEAKTAAEALAALRKELADSKAEADKLRERVAAAESAAREAIADATGSAKRADDAEAATKSAKAEAEKARADLAAALKKAKPAGGQ